MNVNKLFIILFLIITIISFNNFYERNIGIDTANYIHRITDNEKPKQIVMPLLNYIGFIGYNLIGFDFFLFFPLLVFFVSNFILIKFFEKNKLNKILIFLLWLFNLHLIFFYKYDEAFLTSYTRDCLFFLLACIYATNFFNKKRNLFLELLILILMFLLRELFLAFIIISLISLIESKFKNNSIKFFNSFLVMPMFIQKQLNDIYTGLYWLINLFNINIIFAVSLILGFGKNFKYNLIIIVTIVCFLILSEIYEPLIVLRYSFGLVPLNLIIISSSLNNKIKLERLFILAITIILLVLNRIMFPYGF